MQAQVENLTQYSTQLGGTGFKHPLSALTEHVKSEEVGRWTSEPLGSLIGGVLVNQRGVWEGRNTDFAVLARD